jgi:hypothetical protein
MKVPAAISHGKRRNFVLATGLRRFDLATSFAMEPRPSLGSRPVFVASYTDDNIRMDFRMGFLSVGFRFTYQ